MKKILLSGIILFMASCQKETIVEPSSSIVTKTITQNESSLRASSPTCLTCISFGDYFKENVSFFDERLRSINNIKYVKEIIVLNFGNTSEMPERYLFRNKLYKDDGRGTDLLAGDGIYTSVQKYLHDSFFPYDINNQIVSLNKAPIINKEFKQLDALMTYIKVYAQGGTFGNSGPVELPFTCAYNNGGGSFEGDADQGVIDALNSTGGVSCHVLYL